MIRLPQKLTYREFEYTQIDRTEYAALYEQRYLGSDEVIGHEVFEVIKQEAGSYEAFGETVTLEEKELYPKDSAFGVTAWSITNKGLAMSRLKYIDDYVMARIKSLNEEMSV